MEKMRFAENLYKIRKMRCISQKEVAERVGVSQAVVSMWENGSALPTLERFVAITTVLKCSADVLLGLEERSEEGGKGEGELPGYVRAFIREASDDFDKAGSK
ncbi:MAG: helix-turn-helix transcriptional regulator [Clostridia bacterium]|nr:helix-turn-helix transcriptional regulator [Clostridia bacterium]